MTHLSVNVNKIALLRNARGGNIPNLFQIAKDCEEFGAQGITVHPRPDERHVRFSDIPVLKELVRTEFNIEGKPDPDFVKLVLENKPDQVTLVPDSPDQLTSDHGWDTRKYADFLTDVIGTFKEAGIRVSIFVDPEERHIEGARTVGTDRVELYTGPFAHDFYKDPHMAIAPYKKSATLAVGLGLGINAGHDLNLDNLRFFKANIPGLLEVSIGHALVADALYFGLKNTIQMYLRQLS